MKADIVQILDLKLNKSEAYKLNLCAKVCLGEMEVDKENTDFYEFLRELKTKTDIS